LTGPSTQGPKGIRPRPECVSAVLEAWKAVALRRIQHAGDGPPRRPPLRLESGHALSDAPLSKCLGTDGGCGRDQKEPAPLRAWPVGQQAEMFDRLGKASTDHNAAIPWIRQPTLRRSSWLAIPSIAEAGIAERRYHPRGGPGDGSGNRRAALDVVDRLNFSAPGLSRGDATRRSARHARLAG
jgi:hypothetical protein